MFRKLFLGGLVAIGLLTPLAMVPAAQAHDRVYVYQPYHRHYAVIYQAHPFGSWRVYAISNSHRSASMIAENLRFQGWNARVVHR
jgi:hypothetical protein